MDVVIIRAHYFGVRPHYHGHDIAIGYNIHVCCQTCNDHCWWRFSGWECAELEAHINDYHNGATLEFRCDINGDHNSFNNVSDFIDHLRMY